MAVNGKKKILMLSDHALSTSGVAVQSRFLIDGLIEKGHWSVRQFGAAIKHENYDVVQVSEDFIIKPVDGFGSPDMLRQTLATEKPDILFIFTDPRFFIWLWEMEDEIHQICPIAYWHVWDNRPTPQFNKKYYDAVDKVVAISKLTEAVCKDIVPQKTVYIPHTLPGDIYFELPEERVKTCKLNTLGEV